MAVEVGASGHSRGFIFSYQQNVLLQTCLCDTTNDRLYLLHVCVIKVHPSPDLRLEEEGGVMFPVVAHHSNQVELRLTSLLLRHPVKQLQIENREEEFHRGSVSIIHISLHSMLMTLMVTYCTECLLILLLLLLLLLPPPLLLLHLLTSPSRRQVPRVWMTSSARSEWSESQTRPMVIISGLLRRTRAIRSCWPHRLWGWGGGEPKHVQNLQWIKTKNCNKQMCYRSVVQDSCGGLPCWRFAVAPQTCWESPSPSSPTSSQPGYWRRGGEDEVFTSSYFVTHVWYNQIPVMERNNSFGWLKIKAALKVWNN